jgi:hypothetical protein
VNRASLLISRFTRQMIWHLFGNAGPTAARNICIKVRGDVPWRGTDRFSQLAVLQNGISYLAPGRTLRFWAGWVDWEKLKEGGGSIDLSLDFETESGKRLRREALFDLTHYIDVGPDSFQDPAAQIAEAIKSGIASLSRESKSASPIERLFKRGCPTCGSTISSSAKKCPYCNVWIPSPETSKEELDKPAE